VRTSRWLCISLSLIATLAVLAVSPALGQKKATAPNFAKVLILTGGQRKHHGYRDQALYLSNLLEDTGRYEVTINEDAAILETPALNKYDLMIVNADRRDPEFKFTRPQQEALLDYVKSGHGYVSIHGADNAAPDWIPEWREMLGGVFSHIGLPDSKTKQGTFTVKIVNIDHPITRGLKDFELKDELYYKLQMQPGVENEALATIDHDNGTWPVAWTRIYGKGRVFHTPLGHRSFGPGKDEPLTNSNLGKLVLQGIDWVAEGRTASPGDSSAAK
jgi:type 1 glutamine amidotransferase